MTRKAAERWTRLGAAALVLLSALPAAGGDLRPTLPADTPIWTDRPVRVDRKQQAYERLAVEPVMTPLRLSIGSRVTVFDSASFREKDRFHVLTGAVAVDPKRFCRGADGAIAVCGQQARLALRRLIANRTLICQEDVRIGAVSFLTCTVGGKDIAETLIAKGAAWAATPRYDAAQQEAMRAKAGIWIDDECRALGRCPPGGRR